MLVSFCPCVEIICTHCSDIHIGQTQMVTKQLSLSPLRKEQGTKHSACSFSLEQHHTRSGHLVILEVNTQLAFKGWPITMSWSKNGGVSGPLYTPTPPLFFMISVLSLSFPSVSGLLLCEENGNMAKCFIDKQKRQAH